MKPPVVSDTVLQNGEDILQSPSDSEEENLSDDESNEEEMQGQCPGDDTVNEGV